MTAETLPLPNIRKMFIPDEGYTIIDVDLERADAQVVAWEADDEELKQMFREGADIHTENAKTIFKLQRAPTYQERQKAKQGVHAVNYGVSARTLAPYLGSTVRDAENFINRWMDAHPKIKGWHDRIMFQLQTERTVKNAFGFRIYFFDRVDIRLRNQALAWIPQCLPTHNEVLTEEGWLPMKDIKGNERIAVWDALTEKVWFEKPSQWDWGTTDKLRDMRELGYSCTENHRVPYRSPGEKHHTWKYARNLPKGARVPRVGYYKGTDAKSPALITYMLAFQADGCYDSKRKAIQFEFSKDRKIERLKWALDELEVSYSENVVRRGSTCFYINKDGALDEIFKDFGSYILDMDGDSLDYFLEEVQFWDGWKDNNGVIWYSSTSQKNCEWVATVASLRGKRARWLSTDNRGATPVYRITIAENKGKATAVSRAKVEEVPLTEVGCPTVSTGFFMVRTPEDKEISVTGNSTVGITTNKGLVNIDENLAPTWDVQLLLQVHDSLVMQAPTKSCPEVFDHILDQMRVKVPYDDPLYIPNTLEASEKSWGDVVSYGEWMEQHGLAA